MVTCRVVIPASARTPAPVARRAGLCREGPLDAERVLAERFALGEVLDGIGGLAWELDAATGELVWWLPEPEPPGAILGVAEAARAALTGAVPLPGAGGGPQGEARRVGWLERLTRGDGTAGWYWVSAEAVLGPGGDVARTRGVALEAGDLHAELERLHYHDEHCGELYLRIRTGAALGFEFVSGACKYFTGYSAEELYESGMAYALAAVEPATVSRIEREIVGGSIEGRSIDFPSRRRDGSLLWVRAVFHESYDEDGNRVLDAMIKDIGAERALELEVAKLKLTDTLTGVSSRQALEEQWPLLRERARQAQSWMALAHVDVDRFGLVNSALGIIAGDALLRSVARRLAEWVNDAGLVVRLGSDNFVVLVSDSASRQAAISAVEQLVDAFLDPLPGPQGSSFVTVSLGASILPPGPWTDDALDVRLAEAEVAMRAVKRRGGNGAEIFAEAMRTEARGNVELLADLREAAAADQFVLHYQPIVDLSSRSVVAAEALVRWAHPERGLLSPSQFIPLAEEHGLIDTVGRWVVARACAEAAQWPEVAGSRVKVAANLSARELNSPGLVAGVASALDQGGLDAEDLVLEITETAFVHDFDAAVWTLRRMSDLGVHLALDDFGTGYSSLAYLAQLPIDRVKIDRAMVIGLPSDAQSRAVVAGIVGMADALGLDAIAEGVETAGQLAGVRELGCHAAQGYYLSRPLPSDVFRARLLGDWQRPLALS